MRFISYLSLMAVLASSAVRAEEKPKASILKAQDAIVVDGKLTEKTWKVANTYRIDWVFGGKQNGTMDESRHGIVQLAWDESYLYVAYQVFDKDIVNLPSGEEQGPVGNRRMGLLTYHKRVKVDFAMFLISMDDPAFMWEIDHNASNHVNDSAFLLPQPGAKMFETTLAGKEKMVELSGEYLKDQEALDWDTGEQKRFTFKTAVALLKGSTIAKDDTKADEDTGYAAEMRIPWAALGVPNTLKKGFSFDMDGQVIRFLALIRNGDYPGVYHSSYKLANGYAQSQQKNWQAFTLRK